MNVAAIMTRRHDAPLLRRRAALVPTAFAASLPSAMPNSICLMMCVPFMELRRSLASNLHSSHFLF